MATPQYCSACDSSAEPLTAEQCEQQLAKLSDWSLKTVDEVPRLHKVYRFSNYVDALAYLQTIAAEAEREDHHPAMLLEWGKVSVSWWTHKIGGLHDNDFAMASRCDQLYNAA